MNRGHGSYFNGDVTRPVHIEFEFAPSGALRIVGPGIEREIPASDVRVSDRLGDIPRFLYLSTREMVETSDNEVVDAALHSRAQHRLARLIHALESHGGIAAAACVLLVALLGVSLYFAPAALARVVAARVPPHLDAEAGRVARAALAPYFARTNLSSAEQERVRAQLARLLPQATATAQPEIEFLSMNGGLPNAFALPGNRIIVTDQLVRLPVSDNEMAAVLAHELGHLKLRHGLQTTLRTSFALLIVTATTGDLSTLTSFAGAIPITILTRGYSRDLEREADRHALALLRERKIDPRSFSTALLKLEATRIALQYNSTYLSTHPSSDERSALFGVLTPELRTKTLQEGAAEPVVLFQARPQYPFALRARGIQGEVVVEFTVDLQGDVQNAHVLRSTDAGFEAAALDAVQQWRFQPGRRGFRVAEVRMQVPIQFTLDDPTAPATTSAPGTPSQRYLESARSLRHRGDHRAALADLNFAVAFDPQSFEALTERAAANRFLGNYPAAIADLDRALAVAGTSLEKSRVFAERGAARYGKLDYAAAISDLGEALKHADKPDAEWLVLRARIYTLQRQTDSAFHDLRQAAALGLDSGRLHEVTALARGYAGDRPGALAAWNEAIKREPKNATYWSVRAGLRADINDFAGAIADCEQAISLDPKNYYHWATRAQVRRMHGELTTALADIDRAIELRVAPRANLFVERGRIRSTRREYQQAITNFDRALELDPETTEAFFGRGRALMLDGRIREAMQDLDTGLAQQPKRVNALIDRAYAHLWLENSAAALADMDRAVEVQPDQGRARFVRANVKQMTGDYAGALVDYDRSLELEMPNEMYAVYFRWHCARRLNRELETAALEQRIHALPRGWPRSLGEFILGERTEPSLIEEGRGAPPENGQDCEAYYFVGMQHLLAGEKGAAREWFKRCLETRLREFTEFRLAEAELRRAAKP